MNILSFTRNKHVKNVSIFLFFVYLCYLQYYDQPDLVGFGFLFLWLLSFFTTNAVLCIIGSFLIMNCTKKLMNISERFEGTIEGTIEGTTLTTEIEPDALYCKNTCFAMSTNYEQTIMQMEENEKILNNQILTLNTEKTLNATKYDALLTRANQLEVDKQKTLDIIKQTNSMSK